MQTIKLSSAFKKDYKRVKASPHHCNDIDLLYTTTISCLLSRQALPENQRDHALVGNWKGYRECHIKPDILLIYRLSETTLYLARIGTHSELFR